MVHALFCSMEFHRFSSFSGFCWLQVNSQVDAPSINHLTFQSFPFLYLILYLFICLSGWNQVHCYCGHLLASCTGSGWQMVMIVEQLLEWMSGRGNRTTRRKSASVRVCPPEIPHKLMWARSQGAAVRSRQLTAWSTALPSTLNINVISFNRLQCLQCSTVHHQRSQCHLLGCPLFL
jgi:hypothetical protein